MADRGYVEEEFDKAHQALSDAEQLRSSDGSDAGVINRLYYACFHAAQAVLYSRDQNPSYHGAVRSQFGEHVVLEDDATRDQGRLLSTLADLRQQADYGYEPVDADVVDLLDRTQSFVDEMAELLDLRPID